jgi:flavin reductase (DIM6/NTAB) family NADH-FMN oxidoreductase RutF
MDSEAFRASLARFATGVTVVGYDGPTGRRGITVNAFASISLDPPLVLISISKQARSHDLLAGTPFVVNVLAREHEDLARRFSGHDKDSVEVPWVDGDVGPRLEGALAWYECAPHAAYDGGDHTIYLGRVTGHGHREGDALVFFTSEYTALEEPAITDERVSYDPFELKGGDE